MNSQHKAIRAIITTMSPRRAVEFIKAFDLPSNEEKYIIACDVKKQSCVEVALEDHVSPDLVKKKRQVAYSKIADDINNRRTG